MPWTDKPLGEITRVEHPDYGWLELRFYTSPLMEGKPWITQVLAWDCDANNLSGYHDVWDVLSENEKKILHLTSTNAATRYLVGMALEKHGRYEMPKSENKVPIEYIRICGLGSDAVNTKETHWVTPEQKTEHDRQLEELKLQFSGVWCEGGPAPKPRQWMQRHLDSVTKSSRRAHKYFFEGFYPSFREGLRRGEFSNTSDILYYTDGSVCFYLDRETGEADLFTEEGHWVRHNYNVFKDSDRECVRRCLRHLIMRVEEHGAWKREDHD